MTRVRYASSASYIRRAQSNRRIGLPIDDGRKVYGFAKARPAKPGKPVRLTQAQIAKLGY